MSNKNFKIKNGLDVEMSVSGSNLDLSDEYPSIMPSLNLDFTNSKTLDPRITFTRSSTATYVDSDGLIKIASANQPRFEHDANTKQCKGLLIEDSRTNLLTYSDNFGSTLGSSGFGWLIGSQLGGFFSYIPNSNIAPDGTLSAVKFISTATTQQGLFARASQTLAAGTYTFSVYIYFPTQAGISNFGLYYDAADVEAASVTGFTTFDQWVRLSCTVTTAATRNFHDLNIRINGALAPSTEGVYFYAWGAQLEAGSFPTSYIPSTDTFTSRASTATYIGSNGLIQSAATNVARYNYNPLNLALAPKLLLESAANNLITYSEDFSNAVWIKANTTITTNSTTAPDGALTADKLIDNTALNYHSVIKNTTVLNANTYCQSVFLKAGERTQCHVLFYEGTAYYGYKIDLSTGTVSVNSIGGVNDYSANAIVSSVGNGWYRCALSRTMTGTTQQFQIRLYNSADVYTGDGISGIYIWGAQLEDGSFPTSYIPTTTSTVVRSADVSSSIASTRAADLASMTGTNFSSWYNQTEGTLVAEFPVPYTTNLTYPSIAAIRQGDTGSTTSIEIFANYGSANSSYYSPLIRNAGVDQFSLNIGPVNVGNNIKATLAYAANNSAICSNGSAVTVDNSCIIPPAMSMLKIGYNTTATGNILSGTIKRIKYYPERLNDNILQNLTK
jgi:hypothetical protein